MKRINALVIPYVTEEIITQGATSCEYQSVTCDLQEFVMDQTDEVTEPESPGIDTQTKDFMKYVKRIIEPPQPSEEDDQSDHHEGGKKVKRALNKLKLALVMKVNHKGASSSGGSRPGSILLGPGSKLSNYPPQSEGEQSPKKKKELQVGDMYDVVFPEDDPEEARLQNIARRKFDVKLMFEQQISKGNSKGKKGEALNGEEATRIQVLGEGGTIELENPIKNATIPFMKQPKYIVDPNMQVTKDNLLGKLNSRASNASQLSGAQKDGAAIKRKSTKIGENVQANLQTKPKAPSQKGEDDMVIFAPIEDGMKTGQFVDKSKQSRIYNKPIVKYNPLKDLRASVGVDVYENDEIQQKGGEYRVGMGMTRSEFAAIKAMGTQGLPTGKKSMMENTLSNDAFSSPRQQNAERDIMNTTLGMSTQDFGRGSIGSRKTGRISSISKDLNATNGDPIITMNSRMSVNFRHTNYHHQLNQGSIQIISKEQVMNELLSSNEDVRFLMANLMKKDEKMNQTQQLTSGPFLPNHTFRKSVARSPFSGLDDHNNILSPGSKHPFNQSMESTHQQFSQMRSTFIGSSALTKRTRDNNKFRLPELATNSTIHHGVSQGSHRRIFSHA